MEIAETGDPILKSPNGQGLRCKDPNCQIIVHRECLEVTYICVVPHLASSSLCSVKGESLPKKSTPMSTLSVQLTRMTVLWKMCSKRWQSRCTSKGYLWKA